MNRRLFLKGAGTVALATLALRDSSNLPFEELWNLITEFNKINNDHLMGKRAWTDVESSWKDVAKYSHDNFPNLDWASKKNILEFMSANGKAYLNRLRGDKILLHLGNITDSWHSSITWKDKKQDFAVYIFQQEGQTLDTRMSLWNPETESIYCSETKIKNKADEIFYQVKWPQFKAAMSEEIRKKVMHKSEKKHPLLFALSKHSAFQKTYVPIVIAHCVDHEGMHPLAKRSGRFVEAPSLNLEIAKDPEFNAETFYQADGKYPEFWDQWNSKGYSPKKIISLSSEERADIAKDLL